MKKFLIISVLSLALFAEDVMVQRMQSVVDEVTELRARYENSEKKLNACVDELNKQDKTVEKLSRGEGLDYKTFEENRKEIKKLQAENKQVKELQKEIAKLEKDNQRLTSSARILVDKNQNLLTQVNKYKQNSGSNEKTLELEVTQTLELLASKKVENKKLKTEIASLKAKQCPQCTPCKKCVTQQVKEVKQQCGDSNPFPKLMPKDQKIIPQVEEANLVIEVKKTAVKPKAVVTEKASTYRLKKESVVYDAIDGSAVEVWEDKRSFTSNVTQGPWIKITGYFVKKKWKRASKELWIKAENTLKR